MGIPVAGRNIFPSNIQGMPTWYSIRISEKGYFGRLEKNDILIGFNPEVIKQDIKQLNPDGFILIDDEAIDDAILRDFEVIKIPIEKILDASEVPSYLRTYLANMVYVGVLACLIEIDIEMIELALRKHFKNQKSAVETNMGLISYSYHWAEENIRRFQRFTLKKLKKKKNTIMVNGNTAAALGSLYGGLQFAAWYPITPATGITESLNEFIPTIRIDEEGG